MIEPGNFIAGTSLYNADVVKAQSKRMWDGMVKIFMKNNDPLYYSKSFF